MANRNMAAKAAKARRQRRLFTKQYAASYVPVGRQPNQEIINGYKERAKSLAFDEEFWDNLGLVGHYNGITPARKAALDRRTEIIRQIKRVEELAPALMCFTIVKSSVHRARVFFNSERTCFVLMYENYKEKTIRTSMTYLDKRRLVEDFQRDKLRWVEFGELPPQSSA